MRLNGWAVLAAVVVMGGAAWWAAAPLLAFRDLATAAETGDNAKVQALVDFPALRENLKTELDGRVTAALQKDRGLGEGPFGALGALVAPALVNGVVDAAVTPEGVSAILRSGHAPLDDLAVGKTALPPPPDTAPPAPAPGDAPAPAAQSAAKAKLRFAYESFDRFDVATPSSRGGAPITWVMERRGPIAWKLTAIELPPA